MPVRVIVLRNGFANGHLLVIKDGSTWADFLKHAAIKTSLPKVVACYSERGDRFTELDEIVDNDKIWCSSGESYIPPNEQLAADYSSYLFWRRSDKDRFVSVPVNGQMTVAEIIRNIRESSRAFESADMQICFEETDGLKFANDEDILKPGPDGNPNLRLIANNVGSMVNEEELARQLMAMSSKDDDTSDNTSDTSSDHMALRKGGSSSQHGSESPLYVKDRAVSGDLMDAGASAATMGKEKDPEDEDEEERIHRMNVEKLDAGSSDSLKKTVRHLESLKKTPGDAKKKQKALDSLLNDAFAKEFFTEYLKQQESAEILDFLRINGQYEQHPSQSFAKQIFEKFIEFDGESSLNLDSQITQQVTTAFQDGECGSGLFKVVKTEIESFLMKTVIPAFTQDSPIYRHLCNSTKLLNSRDIAHLNTALHLAAQNLQGSRIQELIKQGFPINLRNRGGRTALHIIIDNTEQKEKSVLPFVQFMLKAGANPNIQDMAGNTPSHLACENNRQTILEAILKGIIAPNLRIKNSEGKLPMEVTTKGKIKQIIKQTLLSEMGHVQNAENFIVWGPCMAVHPKLDKEHQEMIQMIDRIAVLIRDKGDYFNEMVALHKYLCKHNAGEESMMRRVNYVNLKKHSQAHRQLEKEFKRITDNYSQRDGKMDNQVLNILRKWLKDHIFMHDKPMGEYIGDL